MSVGRQIAETLVEHDRARSMTAARERVFEVMDAVGLPDTQILFDRYPHQLSGGQQQRVLIAAAIACQPQLLVLDEPTTGLDVTTQRQIIDLLSAMTEESGLAMVYVTHDLALLHEIATRIAVMYAGELVEIGPTETIFRHATHPYTRGLIGCIPSLQTIGYKLGGGLRGTLQRDRLPPGCQFQPRCPMAAPTCAETPQKLAKIKPGHQVACQRWQTQPLQPDMATRPAPQHQSREIIADRALLEVDGVSISYGRQGRLAGLFGSLRPLVIRDLDFTIKPGETMALIGKSGSGKSTVARAICGLIRPQSGSIRFGGRQIEGLAEERHPELRRQIQYIFQNPDASLNPRRRVGEIVGRPIEIFFGHERQVGSAVRQALGNVQLDPEYAARFPDQLSGGERQRVAIARALAADPALLLCDEILSALDVSVQASILALLADVRAKTQVSMLFISHDLTVVRGLADRVCVLYGGQIMSIGPAAATFEGVLHPYTESLLAAVPSEISHQKRSRLLTALGDQDVLAGGRSPNDDALGCRFFSRCARRIPGLCDRQVPPTHTSVDGVAIHCHLQLSTLSSLGAVGVPDAGVEIAFE